jgi:hypothetical protein
LLSSNLRSKQRHAFDLKIKEKEEKQKAENHAAIRLLEEHDAEELRQIRQATVFKATPIKHFSMTGPPSA